MKKIFIIGFVILAVSLVRYGVWARYPKYDAIDLHGTNDEWHASLNISVNYKNSSLVITPSTDKFELPDRITVDIYVKDKDIYSNNLDIIRQDNFPEYGEYKWIFDHDKYIIKNHKDITIVISYDNKTSRIPLTIAEYINDNYHDVKYIGHLK